MQNNKSFRKLNNRLVKTNVPVFGLPMTLNNIKLMYLSEKANIF